MLGQIITMNGLSLLDHIAIIHDHRQSWKISYSLTDILFLTVTAVIGAFPFTCWSMNYN